MPTPLNPTITSAKATLSAADTATLLAAIFAASPLPVQKTEQTVRTITIQIMTPAITTASPTPSQTSTVTVNFAP